MSNTASARKAKRSAQRGQFSLPYARPTTQSATSARKTSWSLSGIMNFILSPFGARRASSPESGRAPSDFFEEPMDDTAESEPTSDTTDTHNGSNATGPISSLPHPLVASPTPPPARAPAHQPPQPQAQPYAPGNALLSPPPSPPKTAQEILKFLERKPGTELHLDALEFEGLKSSLAQAATGPSSPAKARQAVAYLQSKQGAELHLNTIQFEGLKSMLREPKPEAPFIYSSTHSGTAEPFRFSSVPLTSSHASSSAKSSTAMAPGTEKPRRTLKKNPMGVYRMDGTLSARPRNRFTSPGFGSTRGAPPPLKLANPTRSPSTAGKRRRTEGTGATAASSSSSVPFPSGSPSVSPEKTRANERAAPAVNGTNAPSAPEAPKVNGTTPSRASRSPAPPLAHPSPLRQAWSAGSDSETSPSAAKSRPQPTRSANILSGIIKDATPAERPSAIVNPYEAAVPVRTQRKTQAQRKRVVSQTEKKGEEQIEREKERERKELEKELAALSPQAGIEMTVPKGAKRARPPPNITTKKATPAAGTEPTSPLRRSSRLKSPEREVPSAAGFGFTFGGTAPDNNKNSSQKVEIEEVSDEDEPPRSKKSRKGQSASSALSESIRTTTNEPIIEEIEDGDAAQGATKATEVVEPGSRSTSPTKEEERKGRAFSPILPKSSAPAKPSKLRFSYQADASMEKEDKVKEEHRPAAAGAPPTFASFGSFASLSQPARSATVPAFGSFASQPPQPEPTPKPATVIDRAEKTPAAAPKDRGFTASSTSQAAPAPQKASPVTAPKDAALSVVTTLLPVFNFAGPSPSEASTSAPARGRVSEEAKAVPSTRLPSYAFAPGLAGGFVPSTTSRGLSDVGGSGAGKGEVPAGATTAPVRTASFDWGAAGIKAPAPASGADWACGTCGLKNPASATEKCTICDAPAPASVAAAAKPAAASAPPTRTSSFDWAAAGAKTPAASAGEWTCSTCSLKNPASASEKCTVCEAPAPGAGKPPTRTASFDWAAAGMKAPAAPSTDQWKCGLCGCSNPASATSQCTVCDTPR